MSQHTDIVTLVYCYCCIEGGTPGVGRGRRASRGQEGRFTCTGGWWGSSFGRAGPTEKGSAGGGKGCDGASRGSHRTPKGHPRGPPWGEEERRTGGALLGSISGLKKAFLCVRRQQVPASQGVLTRPDSSHPGQMILKGFTPMTHLVMHKFEESRAFHTTKSYTR